MRTSSDKAAGGRGARIPRDSRNRASLQEINSTIDIVFLNGGKKYAMITE